MSRVSALRRRAAGLTLIELMVALAVFAVLGVLSYRALSAAVSGEARLGEQVRRWEALARAQGRIESELAAALPPAGNRGSALLLQAASGELGSELSFLRYDEGRGVRRVAFRSNGSRLEWLLWPGRERSGVPQVEVLLDGVRGLRWQFFDQNRILAVWPPDAARQAQLPAGVGFELELADLGRFQRILALR